MALKICRICGSETNLKHIYDDCRPELLEHFRICANIEISANDTLPKFVCTACEKGLAFSFNLRKQGEETEKKLRLKLFDTNGKANVLTLEGEDIEFIDEELQDNSYDSTVEYIEDISEHNLDEWTIEQNSLHNGNENETTEFKYRLEVVEINRVDEEYPENGGVKQTISTSQVNTDERSRKTNIECETCGEVFQIKSEYVEHMKEHGSNQFYCVICDKLFSVRYRYKQHMKIHSIRDKVFLCSKCPKSFTIQCNLERHIRSAHKRDRRFQCSECGDSFTRPDILKMHMSKHQSVRNIECDICKKRFKAAQHLHYHKKSHFKKPKQLNVPSQSRHQKPIIKKTRVYVCDTCNKVSHHRSTHVNHIRTHTGEKPYICETCGKSFRTPHARNSHILLHTDQRPYQCKVCEVSFRQSAHLKSHMLVHSGVKQHICEFCQKAFAMKCNLTAHLKLHSKEIPYPCQSCPKGFKQLNQLVRHKLTHAEVEINYEATTKPHQNDVIAQKQSPGKENQHENEKQSPGNESLENDFDIPSEDLHIEDLSEFIQNYVGI